MLHHPTRFTLRTLRLDNVSLDHKIGTGVRVQNTNNQELALQWLSLALVSQNSNFMRNNFKYFTIVIF
jgi:hypothetical protein